MAARPTLRDVSAKRDPYDRVRAFLSDADVRPDFAARAFARIEAQDVELGGSFQWACLGDLLADCARHAVDVAAYSALLAARLEHDATGGSADTRARALLTAAAERAGEADTMLCELRRLMERAA
jgi:hypothetical protein